MSWQAYVDNQLIATGKISKGCIIGLDGSIWATSAGFAMQPNEVKDLVGGIAGEHTIFYANGVHLGGTNYRYLRGIPGDNIYCKKGDCGACIVMTKKAVIVGIYENGVQPGQANIVVEALGDYLKNVGY